MVDSPFDIHYCVEKVHTVTLGQFATLLLLQLKISQIMPRRKRGDKGDPITQEEQAAMDKIKDLNERIQKLHEERKKTSPMRRFNTLNSHSRSTPKLSKKSTATTKSSKHTFYHPNIDYVYAEVTNSPYLTRPDQKYSKNTLFMSTKLRKLKVANQGKPLRDIQDTPCNVEKAEEDFVRKVIDYKPKFDVRIFTLSACIPSYWLVRFVCVRVDLCDWSHC